MQKVTIAIPLYNAERHIKKTIYSALNQTFKSIEILIIDDASNDKSVNIINKTIETHSRGNQIRIVSHKNNMGIGEARNTAIKEAKSDYLFYLDSDDLITPNCIELLYESITINDAEIAIASYEKVYENGNKYTSKVFPSLIINEIDGLLKYRYQSEKEEMEFFVWNIMMKLNFIKENQLLFDPMRVSEDVVFTTNMNPLVTKCVLLPNITYTYILRTNSLSQHNKRSQIPVDEVFNQLYQRECRKTKCKENVSKSFFANEITQIMKNCLFASISIIQKQKSITPPLSSKEIIKLLNHPLSYIEIIHLKKHKGINIVFYFLGKLPFSLSRIMIISISYIQKIINSYRSIY